MSIPRIAASIFLGIAVFAAAADVIFGPWDHDGGAYLLRGAYVADGLRPYVDYPSIYPPLVDILTALAVRLPLGRLAIAVLLPVGWIVANCAATAGLAFLITREWTPSLILGGLLSFFAIANGGNHLTLEHAVAFFGLLAFASAFAERHFLAGLFAACAALSKQNGALVFLPVIVLCSRRDLGRIIAGAAIPFVLVAAWMRDIPAMVQACVSDLITYSRQPALSPPLSSEFARSPETVILLVIVAAAAFLARSRVVVWIALACAVLEFLPRTVRNYPHYTINLWPFLVLILALAMTPRVRVVLAALAILSIVMVAQRARGQWHAPSPLLTTFAAAADRVAAVTPPDSRVRQYGSEPIIEFLAARQEDVISKPVASVFGAKWDGSGMYSTPPSPSTTVVVIDRGQPWVRSVVEDLGARGFVNVGVFGRIAIFRSRPTSHDRAAAPPGKGIARTRDPRPPDRAT